MKKMAFMSIGYAGAGKTTNLKRFAERYSFAYVSKDDIATERFGHPHQQVSRNEVAQEADLRTKTALAGGTSVVLDSTFVDVGKRREKIKLLREFGADRIIGILFDTPFAIAWLRNRRRQHVVPLSILHEQRRKLLAAPPTLADGFDHLFRMCDLQTFHLDQVA
jgi:predicted kinase